MKNSVIDKRMNDEISSRMESRSWDINMAAAVLDRKKRKKKSLFIFSVSASSFAAVSLVMFVVLFGIGEQPDRINYSDFLSSQISGTYKTVFFDGSKTETEPDKKKSYVAQQVQGTFKSVFDEKTDSDTGLTGTGDILKSDIDSMIDSTLAQR